MIAVDLAHYLNKDLGFNSVEEIWAEIEKISSIHNGIIEALSDNAREGVLVEGELELLRPEKTKVQSHDAQWYTECHDDVVIQCQQEHRVFFMNTLIDYQSLGLGQHKLVLLNPQAESPCGCGDSFALKGDKQDG